MTDTTQLARLANELRYDGETGSLYWKKWGRNRSLDYPAGNIDNYGYRIINFEYRRFKAHRVIWYIVHGELPPNQIDHIDGNPANNRLDNLRLATNSQNAMNRGLRSDNTSGTKGVVFHKQTGKWYAELKHQGCRKYFGLHSTKEAAIEARRKAELELFGEFNLNGE